MKRRFSWDCLAVCDPLFQRYLLLPPMTDDLLASVGLHNQDMFYSGVSLIPSRGMEEETSSSVICWMISKIRSKTRLSVFIFSTSSGHWAAGTSISWADLGLYGEVDRLISGQCVYGCFYWKVNCSNKLVKLDMNTMELSTYDLPPHHEKQNIVIVESGEGKVGMLSPLDGGTSLEYHTLLQNGTDKSYKWHFKSTIPLPVHGTSKFLITGHAEGYIFLAHLIKEQDTTYLEFISLEVKSLNIERVCRICGTFDAHPYFSFPPSMSPRRIQGYGEVCFFPPYLDFCGSHAFELLSCDCV